MLKAIDEFERRASKNFHQPWYELQFQTVYVHRTVLRDRCRANPSSIAYRRLASKGGRSVMEKSGVCKGKGNTC